jgi:hypothetical protein
MAKDESSDTAQLAVFVRGMDMEFNVPEELAALLLIKGTTTGSEGAVKCGHPIQTQAEMVMDGAIRRQECNESQSDHAIA